MVTGPLGHGGLVMHFYKWEEIRKKKKKKKSGTSGYIKWESAQFCALAVIGTKPEPDPYGGWSNIVGESK